MNDNRRRFIDRVRRALKTKTSYGQGEPIYGALPEPKISDRPPDIMAVLAENAAEANIQMIRAKDVVEAAAAIKDIVNRTEAEWQDQEAVIAWDHPLLEQVDVKSVVESLGIDCFVVQADPETSLSAQDRDTFRQRLMQSKIGITSADYCIAQTATLVLRSHPGQTGAVSLVPSVHVAVILASQILPDFVSFYAILEQQQHADPDTLTHRLTLISGPSKTGDIELVMVHGAHGPRVLHLVVVDDLK
jgi:L-lactate dehydrogenase complex protein LldG